MQDDRKRSCACFFGDLKIAESWLVGTMCDCSSVCTYRVIIKSGRGLSPYSCHAAVAMQTVHRFLMCMLLKLCFLDLKNAR